MTWQSLYTRHITISDSTVNFVWVSGSLWKKNPNSASFFKLGHVIHTGFISPQSFQLQMNHLKTLNDFQKLLGDVNWVCFYIEIPMITFKSLFEILQIKLTYEAQTTLILIKGKFNTQRLLNIANNNPWSVRYYILSTLSWPAFREKKKTPRMAALTCDSATQKNCDCLFFWLPPY